MSEKILETWLFLVLLLLMLALMNIQNNKWFWRFITIAGWLTVFLLAGLILRLWIQ